MEKAKSIQNKNIKITDSFWSEKIALIKNEVIPHQWRALNDMIEGAAPSYCIRNFRLAAEVIAKRARGEKTPVYSTDKWEYNDKNSEPEAFKGWVFQDSDLYKWIEAVGYILLAEPDSELEALADGAIDLICSAQEADGYINTHYTINNPAKRFTNLRDHHELYCFGHLAEAAVSYRCATGKDKLLNAACRFADLICSTFGEDGTPGYGGHEIAEMALIRLYDATRNENYLKQAKLFIDRRGTKPYYFDIEQGKESGEGLYYHYQQAHLPVREQDKAEGHAVRAVYLYSGMADVAAYTDDNELLDACKQLFNNISEKRMYITGGIGSTRDGEAFTADYHLPNSTAYAESCAAIGLVFFANRMLKADYNAKYADVMERCLYNGVLSGMAEDGKAFFYTNPLEVCPDEVKADPDKAHIKTERQKWFGCACCPPNIARMVSSIGNYCLTENDDTVFVNLYASLEAETAFGKIKIDSDYLNSGRVNIDVKANKPFKIALRIPEWSRNFRFNIENPFYKYGYAYFDVEGECEITAEFNPEIRIIRANSRVREDIGKVAITRGPFVYCLEEADNGRDLHLLRLSPRPKFKLESDCVTANAYREEQSGNALYFDYRKPRERLQRIRLIPYYNWANRGEGEMQVFIRI